ncbi:hypothetical protein [Lysobacter niastensis]|uniref:Uncharacterized protein n=1 Tax=Lysobacter niastensis TaxID=380629 RepID=A0ABS0B9U2_9GAMM|nr:hypothetical protein [Lysobacter niastensis]MBF6024417.1 hypothetical protein [Lysobacter niastensis]
MLESVVELLTRTNQMATGRSNPATAEITALFTALDAVHSDYTGFFDMIQRAIVAGEPVQEIAQTLILRSPEADCERTAVLAHMRLLVADAMGAEAHPFLDAVSVYFINAPLAGQCALARTLKRATEHARVAEDDALHARAEIAYSVHASLRSLQRQWAVICERHGMLKATSSDRGEAGMTPSRPVGPAGIGMRTRKRAWAEALP